MNKRKLQTNRTQPVKKSGVRAMHAKLSPRARHKQSVASTARPNELQAEVPHKSLASVWMVVIILHVVAIGVIYVAIEWNKSNVDSVGFPSSTPSLDSQHHGLEPKLVQSGDTYETFANRHNVSVAALREVNKNTPIHAGKVLYIPEQSAPVMIKVAPIADEIAQTTARVVVVTEEPSASQLNHTVQQGDSVYRIAKNYGVSQKALMDYNNITDARHLRIGQSIKIPK